MGGDALRQDKTTRDLLDPMTASLERSGYTDVSKNYAVCHAANYMLWMCRPKSQRSCRPATAKPAKPDDKMIAKPSRLYTSGQSPKTKYPKMVAATS
ncbi:hypothetical protein C8N36_11481 [Pelagimonas varians]|uniref:Uncharacterized protein n=1 Tax=Pelagimonas varians TaxID=696760 RepID=A0A238KXQ3_9RHOB|nr:hypothetical protein C8N36_11481 [Pelagimonas varians]SMX47593.1 hypothetical protein PEV8663_03580 [Pelagimonas varians]